jgi:hypothetical protein
LQVRKLGCRLKKNFSTSDKNIHIEDVRARVHVQTFYLKSLIFNNSQDMWQLVYADSELGIYVAYADFFITTSHQMRVDAQANGVVFVVQPPVFQHRNGVNIDLYAEFGGGVKLVHSSEVGRKKYLLRRKPRTQSQFDFPNGHTVEPGAKLVKKFKDADITQRLAGIVHFEFWPRISGGHSFVLSLHHGSIINVEGSVIFFTKLERVNPSCEPIILINEFQSKMLFVEKRTAKLAEPSRQNQFVPHLWL